MEYVLLSKQRSTPREIFLAALDIETPELRRKYLVSACGDNTALRDRVKLLLQNHDSQSSFMQMPVTEVMHLVLESEVDAPQDAVEGSTVDNYELLEEIGTGGMGTVFKARQRQPVERLVALKVIRPGLDTRDIVARFEAERQTLAMMSHPNIARVLDGGATASGRPYFVMELVDGCHVTDFCTAQKLNIRERLRVVISVCEAVQHAHQRGIIHRDLKPSNILVESVDEKPFVKVIDFGVQKAIGPHASLNRISPSIGGAPGTLLYMSPEQAGLRGEPLDTRTDVYSLGVILYELLTGAAPFCQQAAELNSKELRQLICETDPPLLSKRMTEIRREANGKAKGKSTAGILASENLSATAQKELDWITATALNRQPEQRYESPSALAADLRRFLNGDVVLAAPPSKRYRTQKSLLKHRWSVLLFAGISISLLLGMVVSLQQVSIARRAQHLADRYLAESVVEQGRYRKLAWESIIRRAYTANDEGRLCDASTLLNKLDVSDPEARVRPEWQLLHHEVTNSFRKLLTGRKPLHEVRVVKGSKQIVAVGEDGQIFVVNADTGSLLRTIDTKIRSLHALAISADGMLAAVGGVTDLSPDLARVRVFNLATGDSVAELPAQITTVEALEFSSDSSLLACGARYERVQVFDIASGQVAATLPAERRNLWLSRSPDGKQLAALEATKSVWLCDFQPPFSGQSLAVPWTVIQSLWEPGSGRLVLFLKGDQEIFAFDPMTQTYLAEFQGTGNAACLALSGNGDELFGALESGELISWSMPSLATQGEVPESQSAEADQASRSATTSHPVIFPAGRWKLSNGPLTSLAVSDKAVFATSFSGELIKLQWPDRQRVVNSEALQVSTFVWRSDGAILLTGGLDGSVQQLTGGLELESQQDFIGKPSKETMMSAPVDLKTTSLSNAHSVTALAVSDDGRFTASAREGDESIVLRERDAGDRLLPHGTQVVDEDFVRAIAFSPASNALAWTGDRYMRWATFSSEAHANREIRLPGQGRCLTWSPNSNGLFVGGNFSELIHVDVETGVSRTIENTGTNTTTIRTSQNGQQLVSGHSDGTLRFYDLPQKRTTTVHIHSSAVSSICLSQDGRIGVSCDSNARLALWFAESGELIGFLTFAGTKDDNNPQCNPQLTFANNDRHLRAAFLAGTSDLSVRNWDLMSTQPTNTTKAIGLLNAP